MEIVVKTQAELDALPSKFERYTRIIIQQQTPNNGDRIVVMMARDNSSVEAWGNSSVEARGSAFIVARDNSSVEARDNSSVEARDNSFVVASACSSVEAWGISFVEARGSAFIVARGDSSVVACENAFIVAYGNSSVAAWGNSSVKAKDNVSVVARENSSVEAWGNSFVEARDNSSVVAYGNSSVEAWENVGVHLQSDFASVVLFMFSVCWILAKGKVKKKSKNATIIRPQSKDDLNSWFDTQAIKKEKNHIVLYKRVSTDLKTQEKTTNETEWQIGSTPIIPNWNPTASECGEGKFHACSRPYFCDEFRSKISDKYIAIKINIKDLYLWKNASYPHKIAFRTGTVLYVCNRHGKKI